MGRPSVGGETLGKLLRGEDFTPGGAGCWRMASPDVRHTIRDPLDHAGHVGARNPEALVQVLFAGPAVILVGCWIRGGEGFVPNKGMV